jgi:hypothetical protein
LGGLLTASFGRRSAFRAYRVGLTRS